MCDRQLTTDDLTLFTYAKPLYLNDTEPSLTDLRAVSDDSHLNVTNEDLIEVHCVLLKFRLQTRPDFYAH